MASNNERSIPAKVESGEACYSYTGRLNRSLKFVIESLKQAKTPKNLNGDDKQTMLQLVSGASASINFLQNSRQEDIVESLSLLEELRDLLEGVPKEDQYALYDLVMKDPLNSLIKSLKELTSRQPELSSDAKIEKAQAQSVRDDIEKI